MSLQPGNTIPFFRLKDQNGKEFDISSLIGKQPFVIYFYPKDFTPGCVKEACSFRDNYETFKEMGAEVIGISSDSENKHQKFSTTYNLPFTLLSDPRNKVRELFGVKKNLFGLLPGRETYVCNSEGKVMMVFNSVKSAAHIEKALTILKNIKK
ncbi:peroxiredoxin [Abyssalbus ytuae]|uniref:thioredoxin-dependent peroxiredoxin n=1 Tax=Abyssalbus ytuae TaxID=2926907 RepID=A0A9E6ZJR7_9FLAO|nr:peroxiredoxin [Abyssalbus ytuae]UOB16892.1 peroxiredoxin [Abyssalbus ytuae]